MSETTHAAIRAPEDPIPSKFAEAYAELHGLPPWEWRVL
jgi:hypothetical protein